MTTVNLLPFVGSVGQRWTLEVVGDRPFTVNKIQGMHRMQWARHTKAVRAQWAAAVEQQGIGHYERIVVVVTPLHKNRASPQDTSACAPDAKAAIDGLVDAKVIDDDDPTHLIAVSFLPPDITGHNGMRLTIYEILG